MSERFMPNDIPVVSNTKALLTLFIVDTSGSMTLDDRIGKVNTAFEMIVQGLKEKQNEVGDSFTIYISILEFNQSAHWLVDPTPISDYYHQAIPCSDLVTYFGRAMREVNNQLSRSKKLLSLFKGKIAAPYIMFMTDGYPSEGDDFDSAMDEIEQNGWFANSVRYAVLIGEEATKNATARRAVARFVTNEKEGIIDVNDAEELARKVSAATIRNINNMTHHGVGGSETASATGETAPVFPGDADQPPAFPGTPSPGSIPDFGSSAPSDDPFGSMFPGSFN